jgi:microcin C transport system substrate-binding protein
MNVALTVRQLNSNHWARSNVYLDVTISRRELLASASLSLLAPTGGYLFSGTAAAKPNEPSWRHAVSLYGDVKYPLGFAHFDYVNPAAAKGGNVRQSAAGTYDNFNVVTEGVKGNLAAGMDLIYDTLLLPSLDEPSSAYGLLAEALSYPDDFSWVRYRLCPDARWHDGTPVTPEDVVFSLNVFKNHSPRLGAYYRHVVKLEITGQREITFTFDRPGLRQLPQFVGQLIVLPKRWWVANNSAGTKRNIEATTLDTPLGSGPYRIKSFEPGRNIAYERVKDYWGKDLNVRRGCNNFDELRFVYFRDSMVAFEAFKAGDLDWHVERSAKSWATGYQFPAFKEGRIRREEFPIRNMGLMQAFAFNIRRPKFKDPNLRRAFNFAFDFDAVNRDFFFGQYQRISSYFHGTELASSGLPQGKELEILEKIRDEVPEEVFTTNYWNPTNGGKEEARSNLLRAMELLEDSGFAVREMRLIDVVTGEPLQVEFLLENPAFVPSVLFYKAALQRLGIAVSARLVDSVQYENRLRQRDYDVIVAVWPETLSPGNEQREFWGSRAADVPGSRNLVGIKNPAVDVLIEHIVSARDRAALVAATKALDRVLLWNHYVVPQWSYTNLRTARWDKLGRPQVMPKYGVAAFPMIWWWDEQLVAGTPAAKSAGPCNSPGDCVMNDSSR